MNLFAWSSYKEDLNFLEYEQNNKNITELINLHINLKNDKMIMIL